MAGRPANSEPTVPSIRRERFIQEYLGSGMNAAAAALAAGYSRQAYAHLLKDPVVLARIAAYQEGMRLRMEITVDKIIVKLWQIADLDLADIYDDKGNPLPLGEITEVARRAIQGFDVEEIEINSVITQRVKKIKTPDRVAALALLSKLLGFTDKMELTMRGPAERKHIVVFEDLTEVADNGITEHEEIKSLPDASNDGG